MRSFLIPAAMIASIAVGSTAMAATTAPPKAAPVATASKAADCMKQWKAQKTHTQTRTAFMAACEKA